MFLDVSDQQIALLRKERSVWSISSLHDGGAINGVPPRYFTTEPPGASTNCNRAGGKRNV